MDALFIQLLTTDPMAYLSWIVIVVFSICLHEYAHAAMAMRMGDDTAAQAGHLSLNPLRQMGTTSLIMLALLGLAWGRVPVQPGRLSRAGRGWTAAAGPLANLLLLGVFATAAALLFRGTRSAEGAPGILLLAASANGVLLTLNMLPVPGLDGWSVLGALWPRMERVRFPPALGLILFLLVISTPLLSYIWITGHTLARVIFYAIAGVPG
jgi:Zn-dependent protease